jgi:CxxC motif-containing protein (DUF1111 family)
LEYNYRRVKKYVLMLFLFLLVLLFLTNNLNSKEPLPLMDTEISVNRETRESFAAPIPALSLKKMRQFTGGRHLFRRSWTPAPSSVKSLDGLGPVFNRVSCSGCHVKDGRGRPPEEGSKFRSMVIKLSINKNNKVLPDPNYGYQLNDKAILGVPYEGKATITYSKRTVFYKDKSKTDLSVPHYSFHSLSFGPLSPNTKHSGRVAPAVFGLGLIEAIKKEDIIRNEDILDINNDGVSGRANFIIDVPSNKEVLGRFGWKATRGTLLHHIAGAASEDMGLTSSIFPEENCIHIQKKCSEQINGGTPEISEKQINMLQLYMQTLAVPRQRDAQDKEVIKGNKLFIKIGCENCHVSTYRTGQHEDHEELSNRVIKPYSDFLLHNMGPELDDGLQEGKVESREWKTPPLWGIGLVKIVNKHNRFLHDGRARSIEEAILWHGGEGLRSKEKFLSLSAKERTNLLKFLSSL